MALKSFLDFWSPEKFCRRNFDHEIKSFYALVANN